MADRGQLQPFTTQLREAPPGGSQPHIKPSSDTPLNSPTVTGAPMRVHTNLTLTENSYTGGDIIHTGRLP